jgi:hypothetical protein
MIYLIYLFLPTTFGSQLHSLLITLQAKLYEKILACMSIYATINLSQQIFVNYNISHTHTHTHTHTSLK